MKKIQYDLATPLQYLRGVGPKVSQLLQKKDLTKIYDLIHYFPRNYEDRRKARNIASLQEGDLVALRAKVQQVSRFGANKVGGPRLFQILLSDDSGQISCRFFRAPYKGYFERLSRVRMVIVHGKVSKQGNALFFIHPEILDDCQEDLQDSLLPFYRGIHSDSSSLSSHRIQKLVLEAFRALKDSPRDQQGLKDLEWISASICKKLELISHESALTLLHEPQVKDAENYLLGTTSAHRRIVFEDLLALQITFEKQRRDLQKAAYHVPLLQKLATKFLAYLPFQLTDSQTTVLKDLRQDMQKGVLNRLLQGDVGSGKTIIIFALICEYADSKLQSALLIPTEILAEQHFSTAEKYLKPAGVRVALLTGQTKKADRAIIHHKLRTGEIDLLIGTHALLEPEVEFHKLAFIAIDEQHRFGVEQREILKKKSFLAHPHYLLITATPIPQTLALTLFGDLQITHLTGKPLGRKSVKTNVCLGKHRERIAKFLSDQVAAGRQAYIVYPTIDSATVSATVSADGAKLDANSRKKGDLRGVLQEYEKYIKAMPHIRFGLLHGKLSSQIKNEVMTAFRAHLVDVLITTTVIEVGVDVANANLMIIEHGERFGLAQLHQLRGRVGRGEYESYCLIMVNDPAENVPSGKVLNLESEEGSEESFDQAVARCRFLETHEDGLEAAEYDLKMRGPGDFSGLRQSGLPPFVMAHLGKHLPLLALAGQTIASTTDKELFELGESLKKSRSFLDPKTES